jgi:hypothetical protein
VKKGKDPDKWSNYEFVRVMTRQEKGQRAYLSPDKQTLESERLEIELPWHLKDAISQCRSIIKPDFEVPLSGKKRYVPTESSELHAYNHGGHAFVGLRGQKASTFYQRNYSVTSEWLKKEAGF